MFGYIVHDYTKVYGIKVQAGQLDIIREVIRCLGHELSFDAYFPNWLRFLGRRCLLGPELAEGGRG